MITGKWFNRKVRKEIAKNAKHFALGVIPACLN